MTVGLVDGRLSGFVPEKITADLDFLSAGRCLVPDGRGPANPARPFVRAGDFLRIELVELFRPGAWVRRELEFLKRNHDEGRRGHAA